MGQKSMEEFSLKKYLVSKIYLEKRSKIPWWKFWEIRKLNKWFKEEFED